MTNEQAKQEAIKKAYGEHWDIVNSFVDKNGWMFTIDFPTKNNNIKLEFHSNGYSLRPKSLANIEDNNGWIRIEPDGSNLPSESGHYKSYSIDDDVGGIHFYDTELKQWFSGLIKIQGITHYKPIEPELQPIY